MPREAQSSERREHALPGPHPVVVAQGEGWHAAEYLCRSGPGDRPFEERHDSVTIAAVLAGSFRYRSDCGDALLYPGTLLLGNIGTCFECGHEHGVGDRCVALHYAAELFEEIAASAVRSSRARFSAAVVPAARRLTPQLVDIDLLALTRDPGGAEDLVIDCAERVLSAVAGVEPRRGRLPESDARRVGAVLRLVEQQAELSVDLAFMAAAAGMSRYHFLRTFRRCTGVTPYQYVLDLRMRRAAAALRRTREPITQIALDVGFGDLSTFNDRFRRTFRMTPSEYRRRYGSA